MWLKIALLACAFCTAMAAGFAIDWLQKRKASTHGGGLTHALHDEAIAAVAMTIGFLNIAILSGHVFIQIPLALFLLVRACTRATEGFKWLVLRKSLEGVAKRREARRLIDTREQRLGQTLFWLRAVVGLLAFGLAGVIVMTHEVRSEAAANALLRLQLYMLPLTLMFFNVPVFIMRLLSTAEDEESRTASLIDAIGDLALIVLPSLLVVYTLHEGTSQTSVSLGGYEITFNYLVALAAFLAFLVLGVVPYAIGSIRTAKLRRRLFVEERRAASAAVTALTARGRDFSGGEGEAAAFDVALRTVNKTIRRLLKQHPQLKTLNQFRTGKVADYNSDTPQILVFNWIAETLGKRDERVTAYMTLMEIEGALATARDLAIEPSGSSDWRHEIHRLALSMMHKQVEVDRLMQRPDRRPMLIVVSATAGTSLWSFGVHEAAKMAWKSILKLTLG